MGIIGYGYFALIAGLSHAGEIKTLSADAVEIASVLTEAPELVSKLNSIGNKVGSVTSQETSYLTEPSGKDVRVVRYEFHMFSVAGDVAEPGSYFPVIRRKECMGRGGCRSTYEFGKVRTSSK